MDSGRWLTLIDAAVELNTTSEAVRKRAKRGSLQVSRDNQGRLLVWVDAKVDAGGDGVPGDGVPVKSGHVVPGVDLRVDDLVSELRRRIEDRDQQIAQLRADFDAERRRHEGEVERLVGQFHAERSFWTERADAAECRAEQSTAALSDLVNRIMTMIPAPAPSWWERWFGVSRRSDIRGGQ